MKKIGLSLGMIVFVGVVVIGATGAFFSDTETSTGNTFTAGAIDLKIDNESYYNGARNEGTSWEQSDLDGSQQFFNFRDLKPGDWGEDTISIHVNNNDAYACVDVRLDSNDDNGLTEPEAGDGDTTDGAGNGELADAVNFYWWADDGDNVYEDEETLLNGGTLGNLAVGEVATIALADTNGSIFGNTASNTNALIGDQVYHVGKAWCFGDSTFAPYAEGDTGPIDRPVICDGSNEDNTTQTDGLTATISFYAEQARNNSQFVCTPHLGDAPQEPEEWVETTRTGGDANLDGGVLTLTTIDDVDSRVRYTNSNLDMNLSDVSGFTYDSKQISAADIVNGNASFRLIVDLNGDGSLIKDATFEPYYNITAHNSLNAASIIPNIWQTWAASQVEGKFWASGVTTAAGLSGGGGAYATNFTLAQLSAAYPSAKVVGISIGMGTYNVDQVVEVDNLDFNGGTITGF